MPRVRTISGVPVAPGLAMAPAHVVQATPDVIPTWSIRGEEVEKRIAVRPALLTAENIDTAVVRSLLSGQLDRR